MPADVGTAFVDIRPDLSGFAGRLTAGVLGTVPSVESGLVGAFRGTFARIGAVAAGSLGIAAIGGAVSNIAAAGIEYERTLSIFRSVTRATEEQMASTAQMARDLGNDITLPGVSAAGAAAAMTELAKAGLTVEQSQDAAAGALALAIAAQTSEANAATITANALLAFGLEASEATRVTDLLAGAANASSAEMGDIAYGLQMAGAAMAGAGVPIEDTITGLTMLANAGIRGSDAGTLLKTTVTRLTAPSEKAAGVMRDLGLNMFDANGNFVGMREAVSQLESALGPMTQAERAAAVNTLFGADAMRFANIATEQGVEAWDRYSGQVGRSGQAAELAAAQNVGLGGALDSLQSTLETVGLALYDRISPGMTAFVTGLTAAIATLPTAASAVGGFITELLATEQAQWVMQQLSAAFDNVTAVLPPLVSAGQSLWSLLQPLLPIVGAIAAAIGAVLVVALREMSSILPPIADALASVAGWLAEHSTVVYAVAGGVAAFVAVLAVQNALTIAGAAAQAAWAGAVALARGAVLSAQVAMWLLNAAMAANPVGLVIALIVGLVAALVIAYNKSETFRNIVQGAWEGVLSVIRTVVEWITGTAVPWLENAWNSISGGAQWLWNVMSGIGTAITGFFTGLWGGITSFFTQLWSIFAEVTNRLTYPFRMGIALVIGLVLWLAQAFWDGLTRVFNTVMTIFTAIWGFIGPIVTTIVNHITTTWAVIVAVISTVISTVRDTIVNAWNAIWGFIGPIVTGIWETISNAFNNIRNTISNAINAVQSFLAGIWKNILSNIVSTGASIYSAVTGAWNNVRNTVTGVASSLWGIVSGAFNTVVSTISGFGSRIWSAARDVFDRAVSAATGLASSLYNAGKDLIQGFINGITGMASTVRNKVTSFINDNVPGPVKSLLGISSPSRLFMQYGRWTAQGLAIGISQGSGDVLSATTGLANATANAWDTQLSPFTASIGNTSIHNGAPEVRVFIGDRELTDIVHTEVVDHSQDQARALTYGRRL